MRKMRCDEFQSSLMDFSLYLLIEINFTLKLKNVVEFSLWEPKIMAIEEKLLRCDFSFSNYDKDLTMTLSLYSFYVPTIHSYVFLHLRFIMVH